MNDERIDKLVSDVAALESDIAVIKRDVTNHIPAQISELRGDIRRLDSRLWLFLGLVPAVASAAAALVSTFIAR